MLAQRSDAALPTEITLRPLSRAEWVAVATIAAQYSSFSEAIRALVVAPLALALTGWTGDASLPEDDGLRMAALASWPLTELLAARERLVQLSIAHEGDS